jgi:predicted dehydrogenase/threonine dehydrogenase-like Zn-dependent dehydrogenase
MKQVVQNFRTGELKVEELPPPALRPGGVVVRTAFSLISAGTERSTVETAQSSLVGKARERPDLVKQVLDTFKREGLRSTYEKVQSRLNQIKALGYSASGIVTEVGDRVTKFQIGDRVACAGAGYASHAEVIFVPQNLVCKLPEGASLESASYTTVGAIALHGIRQAEAKLGETVAVIGLGLVGQLTVQMLKAAGCMVAGIDIDKAACDLAEKSGADLVTHDSSIARSLIDSLTEGRGADSVIITAGTKSNEPIELAGEVARDRAKVVIVGAVGLDVPRHSYFGKELDLRLSRSYGPGRYDPEYEEKGNDYPAGYVRWTENRNMEAFLRMVAEGKVKTDLLTTHRYNVSEAATAYDLILARKGERYCGVVLRYPEHEQNQSDVIFTRAAKKAEAGATGVGFIGAGNFARGVLLPVVRRTSGVKMSGIATATGISARNTAEQFKFDYSTTDYNQILDDEKTNVVFIVTRHDLHAEITAKALARGKSVFVEKPLATTEEGLAQIVTAASAGSGLLAVGYNRRFAPLATEIKKRFASRKSAMTIVYRVNAGQLPSDHWTHDESEGGGRVIGEVCHFIDFAQFMTGALPARVSAVATPQGASAGFVDDSTVISMVMTDGSIVSIIYTASGDSSVPKERVEIFCDRSVATLDDFKSADFVSGGKKTRLGSGAQDKGHAEEINVFFKALHEGGPAPISIESLIATSRACFAAQESARKGGSAVEVNAGANIREEE